MKRITLLLLCIMLAVVTYGQSNSDQSREVYALVKVFDKTGKTTATIDFGEGEPRLVFADERDKIRNFASNFEPINLLIKNGWEIEKFSTVLNNYFTTTLWVVKKKVNMESEVKEGMKLIKE